MSMVDLEEIFFDFFDAAKQHIPDSDHVLACMDIFHNLEGYGYDLNVLKGHDEIVDEALEEMFPEVEEDEEYIEDY